jgi:asparagine N-glycosylation enzyme membrane subunit Stt3
MTLRRQYFLILVGGMALTILAAFVNPTMWGGWVSGFVVGAALVALDRAIKGEKE